MKNPFKQKRNREDDEPLQTIYVGEIAPESIVARHEEQQASFETKLNAKVKDARLYPGDIVAAEMNAMAERELSTTQGELARLQIALKGMMNRAKERLAWLRQNRDAALHGHREAEDSKTAEDHDQIMTELAVAQLATRERLDILNKTLQQLLYEKHDQISERCQGELPQRAWYNS